MSYVKWHWEGWKKKSVPVCWENFAYYLKKSQNFLDSWELQIYLDSCHLIVKVSSCFLVVHLHSDICQVQNGGCEQVCIVNTTHPDEHTCACFDGYELEEKSGTKCKDIDECILPGTCSQICQNSPGSYKCECEAGYALTHNRFCKATVGRYCLVYKFFGILDFIALGVFSL